MKRTWPLVAFIACLPFGGTLSLLRGQAPSPGVKQQLLSQYHVSMVDSDGGIVNAGSVLAVAQGGIKANPPSGGTYWYNSHEPGGPIRYSLVFESLEPADFTSQVRYLNVGTRVCITQLDVKPSDVTFYVQTCQPDANGTQWRAAVLFQFQQKNFVQPANLKTIQESIAEVFSLGGASPPESVAPAPELEWVAGLYVIPQAPDNRLQLNADGTFRLVQLGKNYSGTFTMDGDKLMIRQGPGGPRQAGILQGDTLTDPQNFVWVKQKAAPAAAVPALTVVPVRLPSTYVKAQTPADQLQLNADNTFSLQESGQPYHGTFVANGNSVELSISDGPKTTATIQGNSLTDSSGQTWTLREQSAGTAPSGPLLQNDDIIKMVKAGLDDAIIIAKIGSSKCQFDTSTDALIQLKTSGASAAVLKAMFVGGK